MLSKLPLSIPVKKVLRKLGNDIRTARIRRRITMSLMAERAAISRTTLTKIEKGDPSVSFGAYAMVIYILRLLPNLENLIDISRDELGRGLEEENLPKRVRHPSRFISKGDSHESST